MVLVSMGILCASSPSEGSAPNGVRNTPPIESTTSTVSRPPVDASGSTTHTTRQWTRADCRKAAQFNLQHCSKLKGKAHITCYVAAKALLYVCLAKAKG